MGRAPRASPRRGAPGGCPGGAQAVRTAGRVGIEYLTLYAFSSENWARPAAEVNFLMRLLESSVEEELPSLVENNVRLRTLGDVDSVGEGVRRSVERAIRATEANTGLTLLIALNYGGRQELVRAVRRWRPTSRAASWPRRPSTRPASPPRSTRPACRIPTS